MDEMSISGEVVNVSQQPSKLPSQLPSQVVPTPTPTPSMELIFEESDDVNPSHIHYDKGTFSVVEDDDTERIIPVFKPKKSYLRDVRSSKRRHS